MAACLDLAAKSKLFSVIVDDLNCAKEMLQLNQSIKGGVINIFPLSLIDDLDVKVRKYPERADAKPLVSLVTLKENSDPRLQKLVHNAFSKIMLVKDYKTAMEIARNHNLTCITTDLQIVYAGAFITKVGYYNKGV